MLCMLDNDIQQMLTYLLSVGMAEDEMYRQIVFDGEPTKYYVSNYGKVVSLCNGNVREKKLQIDTKGYSYVDLYHHSQKHRYRIHKLVGEYFLREKPTREEVLHHCDMNKQNNKYSNLVYLSNSAHNLWHRLNKQIEGKQHVRD